MRSYNDDLVIASCIGCWVRDTALTANKREIEYKKAMISGITVSNSTFDTKIEGMHGYRPGKKPQNTFEGNDGKTYDLSWIIKG
jgi:hypothetical protein